jgi:hypothetical protein
VGQTAQFTGYVPSQPSAAVTWQVTGGSANGTIDNTGKYTSPASVPSPAQVTISATSGSFTGIATVTITSAQGLVVNPTAVAVQAGSVTPFTVTGAVGQVTWEVNNVRGGDSTYGTIDATGKYSAPLSPPGGAVTITAINGINSGTATATIIFSNHSISGPYAFSYTGDDGKGFLAVAGSFVADGNGNITSGVEDINSYSGGVTAGSPVSGTYTVGPDGRAQASVTTGLGTGTIWQFALISNQHGLMIRFDSNATGSGTIDQQNSIDFSTSLISGNYSFELSGLDAKGLPLSIVGLVNADGRGDFPLNLAVEDINYNGNATTAAGADETLLGTYVLDSLNPNTGRGTIVLTNSSTLFPSEPTSFTFTFYMVDATHLKVVESGLTDPYLLAGDFFSAPNKNGSFSASIFNGNYVFTTGGSSSNGPYSSAGVFTATGTSSSAAGSISSGVFDSNDSGNVKLAQTLSSSTFNVDPNLGRTIFLVTIGSTTLNFAAYPTSTGSFEILELDSNPLTSGVAYSQTPGASFQGNYALNLSGIASSKNGPVEQDVAGQIISTGTNGTLAGTLDINNFLDHGISEGLALLSGTTIVSPASNGRGTLTLGTSIATFPLAYYIVDNKTVLLFETDSQRVMPGTLVKQF